MQWGLDTVPSMPRALRGRDATEECRWIMSLELDGGKHVLGLGLAMTGEIALNWRVDGRRLGSCWACTPVSWGRIDELLPPCARDNSDDDDVFYLFLLKQKRGAELNIYFEEGTYHKRLFRGPPHNTPSSSPPKTPFRSYSAITPRGRCRRRDTRVCYLLCVLRRTRVSIVRRLVYLRHAEGFLRPISHACLSSVRVHCSGCRRLCALPTGRRVCKSCFCRRCASGLGCTFRGRFLFF